MMAMFTASPANQSQNGDQLSSSVNSPTLMVDLSDRVKQITDEASSRAQHAMLVELVMLHDLEQAVRWVHGYYNDLQPKGRPWIAWRLLRSSYWRFCCARRASL